MFKVMIKERVQGEVQCFLLDVDPSLEKIQLIDTQQADLTGLIGKNPMELNICLIQKWNSGILVGKFPMRLS